MDDSPTFGNVDHQKYQMILGRIDIAYSVSSLVCFVACPQSGLPGQSIIHLWPSEKRTNWRVRIDLHEPIVVKNGAEGLLDINMSGKLKEHYPDACESIDEK
eukprot:418757-Ditylum_brightwellii.AAC.1